MRDLFFRPILALDRKFREHKEKEEEVSIEDNW